MAAGAEVTLASRIDQILVDDQRRPDVLHLHWLDYYDVPSAILARSLHGRRDFISRSARRTIETAANLRPIFALRRLRKLADLLRRLQHLQRSGVVLAYTLHNLNPHDTDSWADRLGTWALIRQADVLHVHDDEAARIVKGRYGREKPISVVPHGHYRDVYPNTASRAEARQTLGLQEDAFVYLSLGLLRPYKGLEELLPAFRSLPSPRARLVLAGKPHDEQYAQLLARLAAPDARIVLNTDFVPPDQVQYFMNACDIGVLPYRQITTSGAAMLSFSFGVPIIAPASGAFMQLVGAHRGILYEPGPPGGLMNALLQAEQTSWLGCRQEILKWVSQFEWAWIGSRLLEAYRMAAPSPPSSK
jgi:glycosyltransferase involved in cell wall biosynthesis